MCALPAGFLHIVIDILKDNGERKICVGRDYFSEIIEEHVAQLTIAHSIFQLKRRRSRKNTLWSKHFGEEGDEVPLKIEEERRHSPYLTPWGLSIIKLWYRPFGVRHMLHKKVWSSTWRSAEALHKQAKLDKAAFSKCLVA